MSAAPSGPVLITGCSTGIGRATAQHLARAGWTVYASARRLESIRDLGDQGCELLELDVVDEASRTAAVDAVERAHGAVGALVNNAGYSQSGPVEEVSLDEVRRQFETNVFGLMRMCQLVLPGMRARRAGRIVNISSMGGKLTFPGGGVYHATKHAVEALSDALRFEVAGFGVDVVVVEPGLIRTRFGDTAADTVGDADSGGPYDAFKRHVAATTRAAYRSGALARFAGEPDAVAKVVERALTAARPRPRYRVTASAHVLMTQRRLMPDRVWDAVMRTQFPRPGAS